MANPRDNLGANALLNGEFYLNERTGRTHVRLPAGGAGGGITSYADVPATEEQHVAFLEREAQRKEDESHALHDRHAEARAKLEEKQAKEREEEDRREVAEDEQTDAHRNPITAETYGRPPQDPPGLEGKTGPENPADERDPADDQPQSSPVKEPA